jgi:hypothetical protein
MESNRLKVVSGFYVRENPGQEISIKKIFKKKLNILIHTVLPEINSAE